MYSVETYELTREFKRGVGRVITPLPTYPSNFFYYLYNKLRGSMREVVVRAVDHITFNVKKGEIIGLIGPNGSGKTTLIKILGGLLLPTSGRALVEGLDVVKQRREVLDRVNVVAGLFTGSIWVDPVLTARQNLRYWADLLKIDRGRVDEALSLVGLEGYVDIRVGTFSTGMSAKLVLALGLLKDADLFLLDEPTAGLSIDAVKDFHKILKNLNREKHITVIYATHYLHETQSLFDKVAMMDKGKLVCYEEPRELIRKFGEKDAVVIECLGFYERLKDSLRIDGIEELYIQIDRYEEGAAQLTIITRDARAVLPSLIEKLYANGVKVNFINVRSPGLEEAYLKITGRALHG